MRLPGIQYGQVQSLGREDIHAPGRLAAAKAQTTTAMVGAFKGALSVYDEYDRQQAEEAVKDNMLDLQQTGQAIQQELSEKSFWSANELNQRGISGYEEDTRTRIATHEILPNAYRLGMEAKIESLGGNIKRSNLRRDWEKDSISTLQTHLNKLTVNSIEQSQIARREKTIDLYTDAIKQGNSEAARDILRSGANDLTDNEIRDGNKAIDETEELYKYKEIITFAEVEDIDLLQEQAEELNPENYQGGLPTEAVQQIYVATKRKIVQLQSGTKTGVATYKAGVKQDLKSYQEQIELGLPVDPEGVFTIGLKTQPAFVDDAGVTQPGIDLGGTARKDFERALAHQEEFADFYSMSSSEQGARISALEVNGRDMGSTPESTYALEQFKKIKESKDQAISKAPMRAAAADGIINPEPLTVKDRQTWGPKILRRFAEYDQAKHYNGASTVFMDKAEESEFNAAFNTMSSQEQLSIMGETYSINPEKADLLFGSISKGSVSPYQFASRVFSDGHYTRAGDILDGAKMLPDFQQKSELNVDMDDAVGLMYGEDNMARTAAMEAAKALYVKHQRTPGYEDITPSEALDLVTGGRAEFGNSLITVPDLATSPAMFEDWTERVHPDFITELGGVAGMRPAEVSVEMGKGTFRLVDKSKGQYYLEFPDPNNPGETKFAMKEDGSGPFVLKYLKGKTISRQDRRNYYTAENTSFMGMGEADINYKSEAELMGEEPETILAPQETIE